MKRFVFFVSVIFFSVAVSFAAEMQPVVAQSPPKTPAGQPSQPPAKKAPAAQHRPFDGTWNGKTSQGQTLQFVVEKGRITTFEAGGRFAGAGCSSTSTTTATINLPLTGDVFSFSTHGGPGGVSLHVNGKFATATIAQGTVGMELHPVPGPPGMPSCGGSSRATWTAWKGDKPPDEATLAKLGAATKPVARGPVKLISPAEGDLMDNGCSNFKEPLTREFRWAPVPGAQRYHLYVKHEFAGNPVVDQSNIRSTSYTSTNKSYTIHTEGWMWKVRPMVGGVWKAWSEDRSFKVEPADTDCDQWHANLFDAIDKGDVARCKELLSMEWGDVRTANRRGESVAEAAAKTGNVEMLKFLVEAGVQIHSRVLIAAAAEGRSGVVQALLDSGVPVDGTRGFGEHTTALCHAAENGHLEVVKILLQKGADPNGGEEGVRWGQQPLVAAVENGHIEVVRALLEGGADVNARKWGDTALQIARQKGNAEIISLLTEYQKKPR
ncbi:MAG: ankyrin repeat domain-containing protein [Candidatus Acidiferrales bacterium]